MPRTQDLQPFLIVFSINIKGHINNMMWSQGLEFKKQLLASGDNSSMNVWDMDGLVKSKSCCANSARP